MASQAVQVTKLVFSSIGDPKKALALMPLNDQSAIVGTIIGIAADMHRTVRTRADGSGTDIYVGLKGTFEGIPTDPARDSQTSGVCYMPEAFLVPLFGILFSEDNGGKPYKGNPYDIEGFEPGTAGKPVRFGAEVGIGRSNNPQGYSWQLKPLIQNAYDPLDDLRETVMRNKQAMIEGKSAQQKEPVVIDGTVNKPAQVAGTKEKVKA